MVKSKEGSNQGHSGIYQLSETAWNFYITFLHIYLDVSCLIKFHYIRTLVQTVLKARKSLGSHAKKYNCAILLLL